MIRILFAATVLSAVTALDQRPANAYEAPWCAVINTGLDVHWDCQYQSVEECVPNILAGNRGFCNPNPYFQDAEHLRGYHVRRHRVRRY